MPPLDQAAAPDFPPTPRTRIKRLHQRAHYDRKTVHAILDAGLECHVGYTIDDQPYVTATAYWREGDWVYWHGSSASRALKRQKSGVPVCFTVSLMDGLVLARSGLSQLDQLSVRDGLRHRPADRGPGREAASARAVRRAPDAGPLGRAAPGRGPGTQGDHGAWIGTEGSGRQGPDRAAGRRRAGLRPGRLGRRGADPPGNRSADRRSQAQGSSYRPDYLKRVAID